MTFFLSRFSMLMHANICMCACPEFNVMHANMYVRVSRIQCLCMQIGMCAGPKCNARACKYACARVRERACPKVRVSKSARVQIPVPMHANMYVRVSRIQILREQICMCACPEIRNAPGNMIFKKKLGSKTGPSIIVFGILLALFWPTVGGTP